MAAKRQMEILAERVTHGAGSSSALFLATMTILVWLISGPLFDFSDTWQLVINTGTTIVTFLMVFLIQRTQNKESRAIHLKLNEIISALKTTNKELICAEDLAESELSKLKENYRRIVKQLDD